ncbi:MAG: hypothetical protein GWP05_04715 [Anaerolineaceae bacterium]|nr:hypothetical protein [Anaerolineaceae bacterium]
MPEISLYWLVTIFVSLVVLAALLAPTVLRAWRPGSPLSQAAENIAELLKFPGRLLSSLHTGDVRMHIAWIVVGAALLCMLAWSLPLPASVRAVATAGLRTSGDPVAITATWPQLILVAAAVAGLLAKIVLGRRAFPVALGLAFAGLAAAAAALLHLYSPDPAGWHDLMGLMRLDPFGIFAQLAVLGLAAVMLVVALFTIRSMGRRRTEFVVTILFAVVGMTVAVVATDFLTLYTALALMLTCNYILLGMQARDPAGTEVTLKYFLTSLAASGFLLMGVALLYGATGDTQFEGLAQGLASALGSRSGPASLAAAGIAFVLAGMAFHVGALPFHMHVPDLHQGAPTPSVAFVVSLPAVTGLFVLVRLIMGPLAPAAAVVKPLLLAVGMLSLVGGAMLAAVQRNPRRAIGHLAACLGGILIILIALNCLTPTPEGELARPAFALTLVLVVVLFMMAAAAVAAACGVEAESALAGRAAIIRGTVSSALAFFLALSFLSLAAVVLYLGRSGGGTGLPPVIRYLAAGSLLAAAARFIVLYWRLSPRPDTPTPGAWKVIATLLVALLVAVATFAALQAGAVMNAVARTWP